MTSLNEDFILPQGEALRSYLAQPYLSKKDLKAILRNRGVFLSEQEKERSIPALALTLITPSEFHELQQAYSSKEDNPKITTQTIKWQGAASLLDSIPERLNANEILDMEFETFKVLGAPDFYPVNGDVDCVRMDFVVERLDRSKSWVDTRKNFKASIEIKKSRAGDELVLISTHTAPETRKTNIALSKYIVKHLKANNAIAQDERMQRITFGDFTNEKRFSYLLGLTKESRLATLSFIEIVDIGLMPDAEKKLPFDLAWMKERIKSLDLKGITLEESEFLSNLDYRPCLYLYRLDAKFRFSTSGLDGECVISLGFPEYASGQDTNSEMELKIKAISFDNISRGLDKNDAKQTILKELEFEKIESFKSLASGN